MKTTSLELSRKLKEAGFKQETQFYWVKPTPLNEWVLSSIDFPQINFGENYKDYGSPTNAWWIRGFNDEYNENVAEYIASPTAEELIDQLPKTIKVDDIWYYLKITFYDLDEYKGCTVLYTDIDDNPIYGQGTESLCRSLGEMWLWLKENNLL